APVWVNVVCTAAQGTSPHADSRALVFALDGTLWFGNDGGIFRLLDPDNALGQRRWTSLNDSLRPTEIHSVAYDTVSRIAFAGTQDAGTPMQSAPGSFTWNEWTGGDGGNVAVDADQTAHPGTSIRYSSFQFLGSFNRSTWNAANVPLSLNLVGLLITSGPGAGQKLLTFDPNVQFYNPYVLNNIDPRRMLIGTASIYESLDQGDTLANLGFTGRFITALSYGGQLNDIAFPDVFYVGMRGSSAPLILHRTAAGGALAALPGYPGSSVRSLVMDPQNYRNIYVVDDRSRAWASFDEGASWVDLTADLPDLCTDVRTVEIFSPSSS